MILTQSAVRLMRVSVCAVPSSPKGGAMKLGELVRYLCATPHGPPFGNRAMDFFDMVRHGTPTAHCSPRQTTGSHG